MARAAAALVVLPIIVAVAGTLLIDSQSGDVGMAAVPFILAGYFLGIALGWLLQLLLRPPSSSCIAAVAIVVCLIGAVRGSNLAAWLLVPALGGLVISIPDDLLPRSLRAAPRS